MKKIIVCFVIIIAAICCYGIIQGHRDDVRFQAARKLENAAQQHLTDLYFAANRAEKAGSPKAAYLRAQVNTARDEWVDACVALRAVGGLCNGELRVSHDDEKYDKQRLDAAKDAARLIEEMDRDKNP